MAVKTTVFEAWEGESDVGDVAPDRSYLRYVRAIMETAISASVGHQHVVRCSLHAFHTWEALSCFCERL